MILMPKQTEDYLRIKGDIFMEYNEKLLKSWCEIEDWGCYLDRNGALSDGISEKEFNMIEQEYYNKLRRRIDYCRKLINVRENALIYYTLAELYDRYTLFESVEHLYKRFVRYYCIKAMRKDRNYAPAWALLAVAYEWTALMLGGKSDALPEINNSLDNDIPVTTERNNFSGSFCSLQKLKVRYIEKSIRCIKKAISIEPLNKIYKVRLKDYYHQRNEEYRG